MATLSVPDRRVVTAPRQWGLRGAHVTSVLLLIGGLVIAMWVRHRGLGQFGTMAGTLTAIGQVTALLGAYGALLQLVLMSRSPWLEQVFGTDRLAVAHRWLGFGTVMLLAGHGVFTTVGYALGDRSPVLVEAWTLLTTYPYVLMATVGFALFVAVGVSSVRIARRTLSYETWHAIHLYAYLAIALGFAHQLVIGSDFVDDPVARLFWVGLYVATAALIITFRFGAPIRLSIRHRLRVANVVPEAPGVVSIYLTGRDLDKLPVRSGQFFVLRFLREGWWRGHPFSISAAPNGAWLRFTVKDLGDDTARMADIPVGTRVYIEGPYGVLTAQRRTRRRVAFIAGGIGITPLRAMLEDMPGARGDLALIYRAGRHEDLVFRDELEALAVERGVDIHYVVGHRGSRDLPAAPFGARSILSLIPDIGERDVFVCGPDGLMA
ncbi:MAG TPA: ferredoxin reductase family protein, partial [Candidatus Acidoferrum sp.]|nr:ferredoxin reductase family protein [Candidatus Acidoferrum sp.]